MKGLCFVSDNKEDAEKGWQILSAAFRKELKQFALIKSNKDQGYFLEDGNQNIIKTSQGSGWISLLSSSDANLFFALEIEDTLLPEVIYYESKPEIWPEFAIALIIDGNEAVCQDGRSYLLRDEEEKEIFVRDLLLYAEEPLPGLNCKKCGKKGCQDLLRDMVLGKVKREDCLIENKIISLSFDGVQIPLVSFVERMLANVVEGIAKEMKGYNDPKEIIIKIKR